MSRAYRAGRRARHGPSPAGRRVLTLLLACVLLAPACAEDEPPADRPATQNALLRADQFLDEGRVDDACALYRTAAKKAHARGWLPELESARQGEFRCAYAVFDLREMLRSLRALIEVQRALEADVLVARSESDLAGVLLLLGEHREALPYLENALRALRSSDPAGAAHTLATLSICEAVSGAYADALSHGEEAVRLAGEAGDADALDYARQTLVSRYTEVGKDEEARVLLEGMAKSMDEKDVQGRALVASNLAGILARAGRYEEAMTQADRAVALATRLGDPVTLAQAHNARGILLEEQGDPVPALEAFRAALGAKPDTASEPAWSQFGIGAACADLSPPDLEQAEEAYAKARKSADVLGEPSLVLECQRGMAELRRLQGRAKEALVEASRALDVLDLLDMGLADTEAAYARQHNSGVVEEAVRCALALDEEESLFEMLERTRANVLATALGGGRATRLIGRTEAEREREREAREAVVAAQARYGAAVYEGKLRQVRKAADAWRAAGAAYRSTLRSIERDARRARSLARIGHSSPEEMRKALGPKDALVIFVALPERHVALVVQSASLKWHDLGDGASIRTAHEMLGREMEAGQDVSKAGKGLADRVLVPLQLPKDLHRLLICPDGLYTYLPYAYLLTRDERLPAETELALVPSGTVYTLLRRDAARSGRRLLALGDPAYATGDGDAPLRLYGGESLDRLEGSTEEVEAIAEEGDVVLLREEASETEFRRSLSKSKRWRAVHLACHGTVNERFPTLSALALTPTPEDDGFLTAAEILHLDLSTDLAVLSACESGRGKALTGEGMLGLVRAFMCAGAPRVLASLWKVDDEATRALMTTFHAAWRKPGVSTAEALRLAQRRVRDDPDHPAWKHPRYWAAWVLWGLPD